jgi:hypothetical protein
MSEENNEDKPKTFTIFRWKKKDKTPSILRDMKRKRDKINKLKEEIETMGKLIMKDGKLVDSDKVKKEEQIIDVEPQPQQQPQPQQYAPQPQQQTQEGYGVTPEMVQQMQQEQMMQQAMQQQAIAEQQEMRRQMLERQMAGARQQPQMEAPPQPVVIKLIMVNGGVITIETDEERFVEVKDAITNAMIDKTVFEYGTKGINGQQIMAFSIE